MKKKFKLATEELLSGNSSLNQVGTPPNNFGNTSYYLGTAITSKSKTTTVEIYKVNKKGKETLVGKKIKTTVLSSYPNYLGTVTANVPAQSTITY